MITHRKDKKSAKKEVLSVFSSSVFFLKHILNFFSKFSFYRHRRNIISSQNNIRKISAKYLISLINTDFINDFCILDMRSRDDFFKDHIILSRKGMSINIPFEVFDEKNIKSLKRFIHKKIILYGYGNEDIFRLNIISDNLFSQGFNLFFLEGGYEAYIEELYG